MEQMMDTFESLWTEAYDLGIENAFHPVYPKALACEYCLKRLPVSENPVDDYDGWKFLEHPNYLNNVRVTCPDCDPTF